MIFLVIFGLMLMTLLRAPLFTVLTGVTIVAMGALLYPALKQDDYAENFSLWLLLPPSLPLILYGIIAQQMDAGAEISIEKLFLAGTLPALVMILLLSAWSICANRHNPVPVTRFCVKNCLTALRAAAWEIPLPIFVFAGIYSGYFAVSEAAAVSAMYVLVVLIITYWPGLSLFLIS